MGRRSVNARLVNPRRRSQALIQSLEERKLLATLNVLNYGAIPNDSGDDRNAIVAAINASNNGDTIFFPAGTYRLSKEIGSNNADVNKPLGRGRIYKGETTFTTSNKGVDFNGNPNPGGTFVINDRTVLLCTGTDPNQSNKQNSLFNFRETNPNPGTFNAKFSNLTLRGRAFNLATNVGAMVEGLIIDNCHIDITGGGNNSGVEFTTGLRNTRITNNIFHIGGSNGIYGYNWDGLTIANNWFLNPPGQNNAGEGMHLIAHSYSSPNLLVEQNYFSGLHRMAIEYQGGGVDTRVLDNWYENPMVFADESQNHNTFAYSIVADRSLRTETARNVAIMPMNAQSPDGKGVRIVFELGGKDIDAHDNYSDGGNDAIAINGSGSTGNAGLPNYLGRPNHGQNLFKNYHHRTGNNNGSTTNYTTTNNGPTATIGFNPFASDRLRPEPNKRFGEIYSGGPFGGEPQAPTGLSATAVSSSQINLNWSDQAINESSYRVERWNGSIWITEALLAVDTTNYSVIGLAGNQVYQFRVIASNFNGDSEPSNTATASTADANKPATPTNLVGTTTGLNTINLTWDDNANNETGYRVERLAEDGATWVVLTPVLLPMNSNSYQVTSIAGGRTYQFRVIAVNAVENEESDPSNIAVVQTPLADVGSTSVKRARPLVFYSGSSGTAVSPPVTGAS